MGTSRRDGPALSQTGAPGQPSSYATPRDLRRITSMGMGEPYAVANAVARMQRTQEAGTRPEPHITDAFDVPRGLGLTSDQERKIADVVSSTRVDFVPAKGRPTLPDARVRLGSLVRSMELDGPTRIEVMRRAMAYWRKFAMPDYSQPPRVRVGKSRMPVHTLIKGEKDEKEKKGLKFDVQKHPEGEGHKIQLHKDVDVSLPDDADFQHHATEYAKHHTAYQVHKESDSDRAEAHRHAANLHAKLANAMMSSGKEFRGSEPEEPPEELELAGSNGQQQPSPGKDLQGKDLPGVPDAKRNPPGRDSQIQAQRKLAGKDENGVDQGGGNGIKKGIHFGKGDLRFSEAARRLVVPLSKLV